MDYKIFWDFFQETIKNEEADFRFYPAVENDKQLFWGKVNVLRDGFRKDPFIGLDLSGKNRRIKYPFVSVYIPKDKEFFKSLLNDKSKYEKIVGNELEWINKTPNKKYTFTRIKDKELSLDLTNQDTWHDIAIAIIKRIQLFIQAFEKVLIPYRKDPTERELTLALRYDVLKRDNGKCCICGRTAKDGIRLHVDHITALVKGGKTTMDNLQTLCHECNLGKGTKE